jgi:flagellar hook-associated protein 3 FlgL
MISSLNASDQNFLVSLAQIQAADQAAQTELSTGLKINTVSDAPDQISELLQTNADLSQTQQVETNLNQVATEVNTAESTLESSVSLVERAETLGAEGANSTSTAATNQNLADELGTVLQQLVSNANTTVEGRYIFSGDSDQTAPYSIDLTQTNPVSAYQGTAATREIQGADGSQFAVSLTAQDIFDSPNAQQNVFTSINNLRVALLNNDSSGINSALADVQTSDAFINQQLAFYGTVQDRLTSASNYAQNYDTQLQTQISGIQDANEAQAITQMTEAQTQEQAALESRAQIPKQTLFDYLA